MGKSGYFGSFEGRDYLRCSRCMATFVAARFLPSPDGELAHYKTHQNDPHDAGYRAFLSRLAKPLLKRLQACQSGLDYGCGPGPALAAMFREAGHSVALYDPFFAPDVTALQKRYDFITCTETAEHFHRPAEEFRRLDAMLKPGGILGIMTLFQTDDTRFAHWHYRRDPTHVVFYRDVTLQTIAQDCGWDWQFPAPNTVIFQKRAETQARP